MKKHVMKLLVAVSIVSFFATGCYVQRPGYGRPHYHHERHYGGGYNRY